MVFPLALAQGTPAAAVPTFEQLEALGARIGQIRITNNNIFDLNDPEENTGLFRLANQLHIPTRRHVVERALSLQPGEPVSVRRIEEAERLLRANRYLYDVEIRPLAVREGVVDIEVSTRDTWTLEPGINFGRSGGENSSGIGLREYNLLGTGAYFSISRNNQVDRSTNEIQFTYNRAFDGWTTVAVSHSENSDGRRDAVSVVRPFYALDTRWAAGVSLSRDSRIDAVYTGGVTTSQFRRQENLAEAFGGWSPGLVNGYAQRYLAGLSLREDMWKLEPGRTAPAALPQDRRLVAPFVRYELVEDDFQKRGNRNQMGRPEFFAMGWGASAQLSRSTEALGVNQNVWQYAAALTNGWTPTSDHEAFASLAASGELGGAQPVRRAFSASLRYYVPINRRLLLYGAAAGDWARTPDPAGQLMLGGDNGLRGYPLRYQSGERRVLMTAEARAFTDIYLWRLVRVGGAAFYDVGRAWGGPNPNTLNPGWLSNVGIGLRFFSVRAAFGNVLHVDIARALQRDPSIRSTQLLVKTKASF